MTDRKIGCRVDQYLFADDVRSIKTVYSDITTIDGWMTEMEKIIHEFCNRIILRGFISKYIKWIRQHCGMCVVKSENAIEKNKNKERHSLTINPR